MPQLWKNRTEEGEKVRNYKQLEFFHEGEVVSTRHIVLINNIGVVIKSSESTEDETELILIPWHNVESLTFIED